MSLKRVASAGSAVYEGRIGGIDVVAATIGVGPEVARRTTRRLLETFTVERVVVSGIAGGVEDSLEIGEVIVPERVIDAATGAEYHPKKLGALEPEGTVLTTSGLITGPDEIAALRHDGVRAVEMEGSSVGEVCAELGLPWTLFRAISDRADEGVVDDSVLAMLNDDGSANVAAALRLIAARPGRLRNLMKLARDSQKAANAAADASIAAIRTLSV
jgi:adenosylhomocysteine nucleosidase